jgi:phosphatidylglycerol:prolipoprotein diacylglycerol transferase
MMHVHRTALSHAPQRIPVAAIVAAYTLVFFGALPAVLWELGAGFDAGLGLAPIPGSSATWGAIGPGIGVLGGALMLASMARLRWQGRGWPISHLPPTTFVASGAYLLVRHPIYVGYTAALAGAGLAARSFGHGILAPALLTACWVIYALGFEEPRLRARFGATYEAYARATPLFPLPFAGRGVAAGRRAWLASRPAVELLANRTVLFRSRGTVWVTYGALVALGGAVGAAVNAPLLAGWGLTPRTILAFQLGLTACMLAGGRLVWLAYEWRLVAREPSVVWKRVGFVSFGGYLGLVAFTVVFARLAELDLLGVFDRSVPPAFLISAFGRLGCTSYGCCYGAPCAHGLRWTSPAAKVNRERGAAGPVPRVPTPMLSALLALGAAAVGLATLARGAAPGAATAGALLVYGTLRFGIEHWRDEARVTRFRLTKGQLLSLPIALAGIALWLRVARVEPTIAAVSFDSSVLAIHWPALIAVFVFAFVVCGFHRREVGRW